MDEFVLNKNLSIKEVNTLAEELKEGGYKKIISNEEVQIDFSGLQMLMLLNKRYQIRVEIKVDKSSVVSLSKIGFDSIFDGCNLRLKENCDE